MLSYCVIINKWSDTTIVGIIRSEKYYGDCIFGKTYTIDPIEKKRVKNTGQSDMFFMENRHEAIISKELWDNTLFFVFIGFILSFFKILE